MRRQGQISVGLTAAGAFLFILAMKLRLVAHFAGVVPFSDEWDAVGVGILKPYVEGHLTLGDLLAGDNEHRVLLTRLLVLALFRWTGTWDVVLQMLVNALIHAATLVAVTVLLARPWGHRASVAALLFTAIVGAVPYGWENALLGFNTHFYLLFALSLGCILALDGAPAFSARWYGGTLLGVLASFTLATGALALCPPIAAVLLQLVRGQRMGRREFAGVAVHAAITIVLVLLIPNTTDLAHVHARSAGEFVGTLSLIAAWPLHRPWLLLTHATLIAVCLRTLLAARSVRDGGWRLLAVGLWLGLQFAALAYSRARGVPLSSRYLDIMVIGQIAGAVAACALAWSVFTSRRRAWLWCALAAWLTVIVVADRSHARHELAGPVHQRHDSAVLQARTLHAYLAEGDAAALSGQPADRLPYPDPARLHRLLDDSSIRAVLPPALTHSDGAAGAEGGATAIKAALLGARTYLTCGGVFLLLLGALGGWWRPARLHAAGAGRA